jgi:hypothetical protein
LNAKRASINSISCRYRLVPHFCNITILPSMGLALFTSVMVASGSKRRWRGIGLGTSVTPFAFAGSRSADSQIDTRLISITTTSLALDQNQTSLHVSLALRLCFDIFVLGCSYKIFSSYTSNHFLSSFRGPPTLLPTSFSGLAALTPLMVCSCQNSKIQLLELLNCEAYCYSSVLRYWRVT